jgi:hypothetical protein
MYMCPIPNGFRYRAISLYSSKIVDKKEILRTLSNTGIYFSSGKVRTVYVVQYIFGNSIVISAFCNSCEDMACCSSVQYSETVWNRTHVYIHWFFFLRMADTMASQNTDLSSLDTLYVQLQ